MDSIDKIIALAKRRGFVFPGSEIYGGLANTYDYGPYGVELLRNIRDWWWEFFVTKRPEIYGLESSILMNPAVWEASGHTRGFSDPLVECKNCHTRTRADHVIEEALHINVEGKSLDEIQDIIIKNKILCSVCGKGQYTKPKQFNLLFETSVGIVEDAKSKVYLRGETAQGMFVDFKHIIDTMRPTLPFGIAQSGKCFRNEVTMGKFTFRTLEFDLAEFEYFIKENEWEKWFDYWKSEVERFAILIGIRKEYLRWRAHEKNELVFYSSRTEDLEYKFPFGYKEWFACAYRTDYDLKNHMEKSGVDLRYMDPLSGEKFIPHVIEPTFGISRSVVTLLTDAYREDGDRVYLALHPRLAPVKVAVFPLVRNKEEITRKAREVYVQLTRMYKTAWDDRGNIGKRYYAQDEIGTPFCITIDYDTLKDDTVTIRDRDTAKQERVHISKLTEYIGKKIL
jgi:glycyl-tRNA synthetase